MTIPLLPLKDMAERHRGLTPALAEAYNEAARVCLDRHHVSPKDFTIKNDSLAQKARIEWEEANERCRRAWANKDDATRDGAYACAIAATELTLSLFAVGRAETLTGADYYVAPVSDYEDLEDSLRLEVSGTDLDDHEVSRRLRIKVKQTKDGESNRPAIAVVVGFRVELISMQVVE